MKRAVYIGAGTDIIPVLMFPNIKEFIFIDSQPFSEFGDMTYTDDGATGNAKRNERHINLFSRPHFLKELEQAMRQNNYVIKQHEVDNYILFEGGDGQTIKYYYSCAFPEHVEERLMFELAECDTIILCGHDPHISILNMIQPEPTVIGNDNTIYKCEPGDDEYERSTFRHVKGRKYYQILCEKEVIERKNLDEFALSRWNTS